jgi:hypothetical protein
VLGLILGAGEAEGGGSSCRQSGTQIESLQRQNIGIYTH